MTLEIHIGKARAAPDVCPECGLRGYKPKAWSTIELLKATYSSPSWVEKRAVPGWFGFYTWYWVCIHADPMKEFVYADNPFLKMIPKSSGFEGRSFQLPIRFTK